MELVNAVLFIGAIIAGITQLIKSLSTAIRGPITIIIAVVVGIVVALIDTNVGVQNISIAQGIMIAFGTVGVVGTVGMVGGGDTTRLVNTTTVEKR